MPTKAKRKQVGLDSTAKALRGVQEWFRDLLDAAPDAMVVVDHVGRIVYVNAQTERLFEYQREELIGHEVELLLPGRFREQHCQHRTKFFAEPRVRPMGTKLELLGLRKTGTEFPVEVSLGPIKTKDGVLVTSAIRDITERRRLEESRFRLAAVVESSEDAIVSKSLDGMITSWNAGAERIFEYTEAEAIGNPITIIIPPELWDEESKISEKVRSRENIEHYETVRVTKSGKKVNLSLTISPIRDSADKIVGVSKIARDISARKLVEDALRASEERLRLAHWAGHIGTFDLNMKTGVDIWQPETEALYGLPPGGFGGTLTAFENLIHPDDRERIKELTREMVRTGQPAETEWRAVWPDGSIHWIAGRGQVLMDESGEPARMLGVNMDITERKKSDEALSGMTRKLVEAQEQERARIARELHDDISQRLAMVAIEFGELQKNPSDIQVRGAEIRKELDEISKDVQALSHELHSSRLESLGVVKGIKSWCREFGERQRMEIDFSGDAATVPLDIGRCLFRVLQEALHNALKHSGVKRVRVQLAVHSNEVHLIVSDSGKGFDLESGTRSVGLGLVSMQERVRLVNGTITIESKLMVGTTIHVRVPLESEHGSQRAAV